MEWNAHAQKSGRSRSCLSFPLSAFFLFFFIIKRTTVQYKKIKNYTYLKITNYTGLIKTKQLIQQGYLALTGY